MINTLFFDLDGTLLPMNQEEFVTDYFTRLTGALHQTGLDSKLASQAIYEGTLAMMKNTGPHLNEDIFWNRFTDMTDIDRHAVVDLITDFYTHDFQKVIRSTQPIDDIQSTIDTIRSKGYKLVLATNPLFPQIATYSRIKWANLNRDSFHEVTTYENYHASKPSIQYYQEVLNNVGSQPQEVLMVGNDVTEDLAIKQLGAKTYLITDCLINRHDVPFESDHVGSMADFKIFAQNLPRLKG